MASTLQLARVPHLHKQVEALLPSLLTEAFGVKEQLVGARLHLARRQEPRTAAIMVRVTWVGWGGGEGVRCHLCLALWVCTPRSLRCPCSLTWDDARAWGSGAAQGPRCTVFLGNHRRMGRTMRNIHFMFGQIFSRISIIYKLKHKMDYTSHTGL